VYHIKDLNLKIFDLVIVIWNLFYIFVHEILKSYFKISWTKSNNYHEILIFSDISHDNHKKN